MRKILVLFFFMLVINTLNAQIVLTSALVDSISSKLYPIVNPVNYANFRSIRNFATLERQKNSLYVSSASINWRQDIHEDMMIYISGERLIFIKLRNVEAASGLLSRLIKYDDPSFEKALDSIKFRKEPFSGLVSIRSPLEVFRIRRKLLSRNTYVITSKKYIPYLSAPEEFIPLKNFAESRESTEIEAWYYDVFGKLNQRYYDDMKPREKIILRMPK